MLSRVRLALFLIKMSKQQPASSLSTDIFEDSRETFNFDRLRSRIAQARELEKVKMERLSSLIKGQLAQFESTAAYLQANVEQVDKLQARVQYIKTLGLKNQPEAGVDQALLKRLLITKNNLSRVVDLMNDFLNITGKLEEMEVLVTDSANFLAIQSKLDTLLNLEKIVSSSGGKRENYAKFAEKFAEVHSFQTRFIGRVLEVFKSYLAVPRTNPDAFKNAIQVIEMNDRTSGNESYSKQMLSTLNEAVANRFDERLAGKDQVHLVLENINFSVDDLLVVWEFVRPLFPERYKIFEFFEDAYKGHIQKRILPFMKDLAFLKENPGTLVFLFNWLQSYEKLLAKVGFEMGDFDNLRTEIKKNLPIFFNHLSGLFRDYLRRNARNDDAIFAPDHHFETYDTALPDDIAIFLNHQIDFLVTQIQGEMLASVFGDWTKHLTEWIDENVS